MKSDKEILDIYKSFKINVLPQLNVIYELEKKLLSKRNLFNKKKYNHKIATLYEEYHKHVSSMWESIYSSSEEYNNTIMNLEILQSGKTVTPNATEIGRVVEQLFMSLDCAIVAMLWHYNGHTSKENANQIHDVSIKFMLEVMGIINTKYIR